MGRGTPHAKRPSACDLRRVNDARVRGLARRRIGCPFQLIGDSVANE